MPQPVRILLLGPPSITYNDAPLKLTRRAHRTLLYYLACHRQPVSRSDLVLLMWEDASPEAGRAGLRALLARLRSELPDENLLDIDRERIELVDDGFEVDIRLFEELTTEATRLLMQILPSMPLPEGLRVKMVKAVELWRTPHFMDGAEVPESEAIAAWMAMARQQYEAGYLRLLERLAEHDALLGNIAAAINWLQKALACSPCNDILHARLIGLYERQNLWSEALNHLQFLEEYYEQEGLEITPALAGIAKRVRERAALAPEDQATRWPGRITVRVPMFGRQIELEQIQAAWRRGAITLIYGEAGSGKTRLVQEFAASLDPAPRLLAASARPLENGLPFQPLVDMLRLEVRNNEWHALPRNWQSALSLLLPELGTTLGVQSPPSPAALSQPLLFEALHQLLLLLRKQQHLLIVVDDAQWCDKTSLEALAFLIERKFFGPQAALILACRLEESNSSLSHFITHLPDSPLPLTLQLSSIDPEAITKIARFVLGFSPSKDLAVHLQQETGGNPLFLLETLRTLLDYNLRPEQIEATLQVPLAGSIQMMVRERLKHLSAPAHHTLHLAAVVGNQIPLAVLQGASSISPEHLVEALEDLEKLHLLQSDSQIQPSGGYRFIHAKIRELILLELGLARSQMMHLRVAQVLENLPGSPSAIVAEHFEQGGELLPAFDYWLKAAQYARRLYSTAEANAAYRRAEMIVQRYGDTINETQIYNLYQSWGSLTFDTADVGQGFEIFTNLLRIGQTRGSKLLIATAHLGLATGCDLQDRAEEGMEHLRQAEFFLPELGRLELTLTAHFRRGGFLIISNRYPEAIADLQQARQIAIAEPFPGKAELLSGLDYRFALAKLLTGWPEQSIEIAEEALQRSRAALNQPFAARALVALSYSNFLLGHNDVALNQARDGQNLSEAFQNLRLLGIFLAEQAQVEVMTGQLDRALLHAQQALECSRQPHLFRNASFAYRILGDVYQQLGELTLSRKMYESGLNVPLPGYHTADIQFRLAHLLALQGHLQDSLKLIQDALDFSKDSGLDLFHLGTLIAKAAIYQIAGRYDEAIRLAESCSPQSISRNLPRLRCQAYLVIGNSLFKTGRLDEARQKALAVAQNLRELRYRSMELSATRLLMDTEKASGRSSLATADRIKEIIHFLDTQTQSEALRTFFDEFRKKILATIETAESSP
jgi:DNA-binding SARP family transcriptional activator/tetratricopeptide (TPR) repeat protein